LAHYPHVVFKDGYGMQRLVQEQFQQQGIEFRAALELNTLDAFCGVVRQGEFVALLPHTATLAATVDSGLVVRPTAAPHIERQVVLVTTRDRLNLPPIRYFRQLVRQGRDSGTFPPKLNRSNSNNTGPLSFGDRLETPTAAPA
jgi:DNA-binding transcriptional LysR family regulator